MADQLNLSLDELMERSKKSAPKNNSQPARRGRGGRAAPRQTRGGAARREPTIRRARDAPYQRAPRRQEQQMPKLDADDVWQHDMYDAHVSRAPVQRAPQQVFAPLSTGTKIMVTNLNDDILDSDMEELFGNVGEIKGACVHYDSEGRSRGTAEITFRKRADAMEAIEKYNNRELDGRPLRIHLMGSAITGSNGVGRPAQPARQGGTRGRGAGAASGMFSHRGDQQVDMGYSQPPSPPAFGRQDDDDVQFTVTMNGAPIAQRMSGGPTGACFTCGGMGHRASNCPNSGGAAPAPRSGGAAGACFTCGGMGHRASNCPNSSNGRQSGGRQSAGRRAGGGGGRGRAREAEPAAEDLDAELEAYHNKNQ